MKKGRTVADAAYPWTRCGSGIQTRLKAHELAEQGIETLALAGVTIDPTGLSVSGADEEPFGQTTATEARVRFPSVAISCSG
jgi:hypothetical protein